MHELILPHIESKIPESILEDRHRFLSSKSSVEETVMKLFNNKSPRSAFIARQLIYSQIPSSAFIERYLNDNEGRRQDLTLFPMMRQIYDHLPQKLLLKCSRKTLKSTLLSNVICLNLIRWNHYHMLYVAPQEASTKYFSSNYVGPRFDSPEIKRIFVKGWDKNDVYEKIFGDTKSSVLFKYAKEDATRCRGPATDHNIHDEVQDIDFAILPIIKETMALSNFKREIFAGTPLTTDNTINKLWESSTQLEWATKCTGCNHWNMLTVDNDPMKMIREEGFSCSRCSKTLDTTQGEWVSTYLQGTASKKPDLVGYHLAQPILPFFNQNKKEWGEFYQKVTDGKYGVHQIFNEAFGIAYDVGMKPITEEELKKLCILGPTRDNDGRLKILEENQRRYVKYTSGIDWGVNMITSRTAVVHGAMRNDGVYEVFDAKIFESLDYKDHIREIAAASNKLQSICVCDSGPDAFRGHELMDATSPMRCLLARYGDGKLIQAYDMPSGAHDPKQNRYVLHKSDCLGFTFRMLKGGKILFPDWLEMKIGMQDILNEFIEVDDGSKKQTALVHRIRYRHDPLKPDDFLHALTFAIVAAFTAINDPLLNGASSSFTELTPND